MTGGGGRRRRWCRRRRRRRWGWRRTAATRRARRACFFVLRTTIVPSYCTSSACYLHIFGIVGVFQLCEELERCIRDYWWGVGNGKRKTHWIAWQKFARCKSQGSNFFNQALLTRQAWRLLVFPDSLCVRLLKAKYFPNGDILDTTFPRTSSSTWKAIEHGLDLLKKGAVLRRKSKILAQSMDSTGGILNGNW